MLAVSRPLNRRFCRAFRPFSCISRTPQRRWTGNSFFALSLELLDFPPRKNSGLLQNVAFLTEDLVLPAEPLQLGCHVFRSRLLWSIDLAVAFRAIQRVSVDRPTPRFQPNSRRVRPLVRARHTASSSNSCVNPFSFVIEFTFHPRKTLHFFEASPAFLTKGSSTKVGSAGKGRAAKVGPAREARADELGPAGEGRALKVGPAAEGHAAKFGRAGEGRAVKVGLVGEGWALKELRRRRSRR